MATDAPQFNLRALVNESIGASITADPGAVADAVFARIAAKDRPAALRQALRQFVRQVISEGRLATHITSPEAGGGSIAGGSAKVSGIRDYWQKALRDAVHVGGGEWKFLGECNAADLLACAEQRRELASRNRAKAAQYDILRNLVEEHRVDRVKDLPANVLVGALGRVA